MNYISGIVEAIKDSFGVIFWIILVVSFAYVIIKAVVSQEAGQLVVPGADRGIREADRKDIPVRPPDTHEKTNKATINITTIVICGLCCLLTIAIVIIIILYPKGKESSSTQITTPKEGYTDCRARCDDSARRYGLEQTHGIGKPESFYLRFYQDAYQKCMEGCR